MQQKGRPVVFLAKGLGIKHQAVFIYDKEMLTVLLAVRKWHAYLVGRRFQIRTDHHSLKFSVDKQLIMPFQQKWVVKMLGHDYYISYKKGSQNKVDDTLSRMVHEGQFLQCISSTSWPDMWTRIKESCLTNPHL